MSRDDNAGLWTMFVLLCALGLVLALVPADRPARVVLPEIAPTASSTSTSSTTVARLGIRCVDRDGYPVHTDAATARRAHLTCPTLEGTTP